MRKRSLLAPVATAFLLCFTLAACDSASVDGPGLANASNPTTSTRGVTPDEFPGNFVSSSDDQVCFDIFGDETEDMIGFKIDPATGYSDSNVKFFVSADGKTLSWLTENGTSVLGVIVKGGPNYNLYDYIKHGTFYPSDGDLVSPLHRRSTPQISHYNVCYRPPTPTGDQGCTPGYWRNHADRWVGAAPGDSFDGTFGVTHRPGVTLGQAVSLPQTHGTFAFHAVAALLNAHGGTDPNMEGQKVTYAYSVTKVIEMVQDAVNGVGGATIEGTKNLFQAANEAGCPLSGTKAVKV